MLLHDTKETVNIDVHPSIADCGGAVVVLYWRCYLMRASSVSMGVPFSVPTSQF